VPIFRSVLTKILIAFRLDFRSLDFGVRKLEGTSELRLVRPGTWNLGC